MKTSLWLVRFATLLVGLLLSLESLAALTFGAEFTFTNNAIRQAQTTPFIVNNDEAVRHQELMVRRAKDTCGKCTIQKETNSYGVVTYKIRYPDGFYFVIATDPSCVEVQTKPSTGADIAKNRARLERDLFGAAKAVGMAPSPSVGGGHIHFGYLSATEGKLLKTRNILVDFANHPELADGVFSTSRMNAPPLASLPADRIAAFEGIIADVDSGKIRSVKTLLRRVSKEVYNYSANNITPPEKYQALNDGRIVSDRFEDDEKTFELRFFLAQNNTAEFEMQTQLIEGRMDYLNSLNAPLPLNIPNQRMMMSEKYDRFSRWVAEAGFNFQKVRDTLTLQFPDMARRARIYSFPKSCQSAMAN